MAAKELIRMARAAISRQADESRSAVSRCPSVRFSGLVSRICAALRGAMCGCPVRELLIERRCNVILGVGAPQVGTLSQIAPRTPKASFVIVAGSRGAGQRLT
jgi:hypothetical protein